MLSTHHMDGRLKRTVNLVPTREGGLRTRPGALQLVSGPVKELAVWGDRLVLERNGRIVVWDGTSTLHDMAPVGRFLHGSSFQALTGGGAREDRCYLADGVRPLWYIAARAGGYVAEGIANTVLDTGGARYPVPVPLDVATWRGRLWVVQDEHPNRLQHCQNEAPDEWDPLWTITLQAEDADRILGLQLVNNRLVAGLRHTMFEVTGTSQYNFQRDPIATTGISGPHAMAAAESVAFHASGAGLHAFGRDVTLSDDVRDHFAGEHYEASLTICPRHALVYCASAGRLLAMSLATGLWGEVSGHHVTGVFRLGCRVGWWGDDGVWVYAAEDAPDITTGGVELPVTSTLETWEVSPNLLGDQRAELRRTYLRLGGSHRANATYTATAQGEDQPDRTFTNTLTLADGTAPTWDDFTADAEVIERPRPVLRELVPRLTGSSFRHTLTADCHVELRDFAPRYHFAGGVA